MRESRHRGCWSRERTCRTTQILEDLDPISIMTVLLFPKTGKPTWHVREMSRCVLKLTLPLKGVPFHSALGDTLSRGLLCALGLGLVLLAQPCPFPPPRSSLLVLEMLQWAGMQPDLQDSAGGPVVALTFWSWA